MNVAYATVTNIKQGERMKSLKKVIVGMLMATLTLGSVQSADVLVIDTETQIKDLIKKLAEPYDLVETITVIAKIESNFGLYVVNLTEGSCGITQINIKTYIARHKIKDTRFNRNKACSDLVNSYELSIANSIEELVYWKQQFCNKQTGKCTQKQYENIIRAYNGGWKGYKGRQTKEYYEKFKAFHKELFPKNPSKKQEKPKKYNFKVTRLP